MGTAAFLHGLQGSMIGPLEWSSGPAKLVGWPIQLNFAQQAPLKDNHTSCCYDYPSKVKLIWKMILGEVRSHLDNMDSWIIAAMMIMRKWMTIPGTPMEMGLQLQEEENQ